MRNARSLEIAVGLFVVIAVAALAVLALRVSNITVFQQATGYSVTGHFRNIGGLRERAPVTMAGVQVGRVSNIGLDKDNYEARVELTISSDYDNLPADTSAGVRTSGLLGEQYIALQPGGMQETLAEGDELMLTESALILEDLISQFIYSQKSGKGNE